MRELKLTLSDKMYHKIKYKAAEEGVSLGEYLRRSVALKMVTEDQVDPEKGRHLAIVDAEGKVRKELIL